jgi:hypothetical protein
MIEPEADGISCLSGFGAEAVASVQLVALCVGRSRR